MFSALLSSILSFTLAASDRAIKIGWNAEWMQTGTTAAGGNGEGGRLDQLHHPRGIRFDDDDQSIYVADEYNHRIVQWKSNVNYGQLVAGGNGNGSEINQLYHPADIILNKKNNSLIIADRRNRRIVEWSRRNHSHVQVLLSDIDSRGLAMDKDGSIYISSYEEHAVKRWKVGDKHPVIIAGGNGEGDHFNQLRRPWSIFVDDDYSLYISDHNNHRVMKWIVGATEGRVVAGGNGHGNSKNHLNHPVGLAVDQFGRIYVADCANDRVVRWDADGKEGVVIVGGSGGHGKRHQSNELVCPFGLTFDRQGNLYVTDHWNYRVRKYSIQSKS